MRKSNESPASEGAERAEFKVVILGDKGVGKTSLAQRFVEGTYSNAYQPTIGAFFMSKRVTTSTGMSLKMQLWDTAGQERFRAMAPMYYRNCSAAIVCFDITNETSFMQMKDWVAELAINLPLEKVVLAIACTKLDLESARLVSHARALSYSREVGASLFETSARAGHGVDELFHRVTEEVASRHLLGQNGSGTGGSQGQDTSKTVRIEPGRDPPTGTALNGNKSTLSSSCCKPL